MTDKDSKKISTNKTNNNNNEDLKEHEIYKTTDKPDFTPEKEKIKGPTHASSSGDKVEMGISKDELKTNPFGDF